MSQRMYSQGKKNFKGLEYEGGGCQGCMTTFLFVPLRSKNVPSVFSPADIFLILAVFATPGSTDCK